MNTTLFWGGGEKWHYETAKEFSEKGFKTLFIVEKGGILEKKLQDSQLNIEIHAIRTSKTSFLNPFKIKQVTKILRSHAVSHILFNGPKDLKIGGLSAYFAQTKHVIYRRGIAVLIKKSFFTSWIFNKVITHFIFNSKSTEKLVEQNYAKELKSIKTKVIYNALPIVPLKPKIKTTQFTIGNAGRIVEQKGQMDLILIAQALLSHQDNFIIKVAGDGPLKEELEQKVHAMNLQNHFEFLGFVRDMESFMQSIDVFVSTAYWEGFGFVLAEAMLQEKPVLAYNTSSNPELIITEKNGYLIPLSHTEEFAKILNQLANNEEWRETLGSQGRKFVQENFEKEKQFKKLLTFLTD